METKQQISSSSDVTTIKPLRCIVKLGGAAITCKNEIEKINEENLGTVSSQLRHAMISSPPPLKSFGMDWSKRPGTSEISVEFEDPALPDYSNFLVVHGAGSFGHFQASRSAVHKGGLHLPLVKAGFVATRISVTTLNIEIVRSLAREGIPSIGISPFACGWSTCERHMAHADISQGCTILSGDVIIRHLAELLKPEYVVFLTDVLGVYDRPPTDPNAILLQEIAVDEDGSWSIIKPTLEGMNKEVEITVAAHDTTGGMVTKISEAAMIAKLGIDVYIVKAATEHSLRALKGEVRGHVPDDWLGTVIRSSK